MVHKMNLHRPSYGEMPVIRESYCNHCNKTLVVDDNFFNIMSIQMLLVKTKLIPRGVDKALDGLKGLNHMRKKKTICCKQPYQLVIVDLNMPNLDGLGMMKQIKEEGLLNDTIFILASC
jgi:CheY-like chemotaxis protein